MYIDLRSCYRFEIKHWQQALAVTADLQWGWFLFAAAQGTLDHGPLGKVCGCDCVAAE
jgi:hypothetical protein